MSDKIILMVVHAPSEHTCLLADALYRGAQAVAGVRVCVRAAWDAQPQDVLQADAVLLMTSENFGYMSGALKDFFDRCYYPLLEHTQGSPCGLLVRAGLDGTGAQTAVQRIVTGLRWRWVAEPMILRGEWQNDFVIQAQDLAEALACGLESGIF